MQPVAPEDMRGGAPVYMRVEREAEHCYVEWPRGEAPEDMRGVAPVKVRGKAPEDIIAGQGSRRHAGRGSFLYLWGEAPEDMRGEAPVYMRGEAPEDIQSKAPMA